MAAENRRDRYNVIFIGVCAVVAMLLLGNGCYVEAANISEFVKITPSIGLEGVYDDNVFELSDTASLPENGKEREDYYLNAKAGIDMKINLERPYLALGVQMMYNLDYLKYSENTDLDGAQNNLDFNFTFASKYEEGIVRDRLKLNIKNVLSLIPLDDEEPLYPGNQAIKNDFLGGVDYRLVSTRRVTFTVGYSYNRIDFEEDDPIEVATIQGYRSSSELTQESQTHTGRAEFKYILNSRITYLGTYTYAFVDREENAGEFVSANFSRQNVLGGFEVQLSPRIHGDISAGYSWTRFEDIENLEQEDQNDFVAEASITANFANQPLMTAGYRKYYTENDFGDTLLTDNIFGRIGIKIVKGFFVNLTGDYILEDRSLLEDETTQKIFGINAEYGIAKNMKLLAGYDYKDKDFFTYNFLTIGERKETSHVVSGGAEYKIGRYVLLKGMYFYTDKTSDISDQEFSKNKFTVSGKVIF